MDMYGNCGALADARLVFDNMQKRNVFSWNIMIAAYALQGQGKDALTLFTQMHSERIDPDRVTYSAILSVCSDLGNLGEAKVIHGCIVKDGLDSDTRVGTALINLYGKCGTPEDARMAFEKIYHKDVISWTMMITAFTEHGHPKEAIQLYHQMQLQGTNADKLIFISILGACASVAALKEGKEIHAAIVKAGLESDDVVGNALMNMYSKDVNMIDACRVFEKINQRCVVSWNTMISAYAQHNNGKEALLLFQQMQQEGLQPDEITFLSFSRSCFNSATLADGKLLHRSATDRGYASNCAVGTALVVMYGKCGSLQDAWMVFEEIEQRDVASWNAMIAAYVQNGQHKDALQTYRKMQQEAVKPNEVTFISVLGACANLAALAEGKVVHATVVDGKFESNLRVCNALINMYAKCGSLEEALGLFDRMHHRDVVSWNALITAHAQHGHVKEALQLFLQMQHKGILPDDITFMGVLSACNHGGMVDDGHRYFTSMHDDYGITPTLEHYGCMIDLFGRAGHLQEAEDFIRKMPIQPNALVWMSLLGACRAYGDMQRGKWAAEQLIMVDPQFAAPYVVLANIYAAEGKWNEVAKWRKAMDERVVKQLAGCSLIEVKKIAASNG